MKLIKTITIDPVVAKIHRVEHLPHAGRMARGLASSVLWDVRKRFKIRGAAVVGEPLIGVGSTLWGIRDIQGVVDATERVPAYHEAALSLSQKLGVRGSIRRADAKVGPLNPIDILFTSPMFPQSHSPGTGAYQKRAIASSSLHAGGDVPEFYDWPKDPAAWCDYLADVLRPWVDGMSNRGIACIHAKDAYTKGELLDVGGLVAFVLGCLGLDVLGHMVYKLPKISLFARMGASPKTPVVSFKERTLTAHLSCGHSKTYKKFWGTAPKKAICMVCLEGKPIKVVTRERFIVAQKG